MTVPGLRVRIGHLYAELNLTGDRGNVIALAQRCQWHGFSPEVTTVGLAEETDLKAFDLICLAAGQDRQLDLIVGDMRERTGAALTEAVADGTVLLAIGGAFQALGRQYVNHDGELRAGLGLFNAHTEAAPQRTVGNVAISVDLDGVQGVLVGFENHHGHTYLGAGAKSLGRVVLGKGNNGHDGTEGICAGSAYGTYLHGPILPRNPWFADHLLAQALRRRYQDAPLRRLDDSLENEARATMLQRLGVAGTVR